MSFKPCTCYNLPEDRFEYMPELKTGNKFVTLKVEKKIKKVLVKGPLGKNWKDKEFSRDLLIVTYPGYGGPVFPILSSEREKYVLVVNHTKRTAGPVLKELFRDRYGVGKVGQKVHGDSGLPHPGEKRSDVEGDKKRQHQNKRGARKHE